MRVKDNFAMQFISTIKGDLSGALSAAIITLPMSIGYGILAFAPLGTEFAPRAAMIGVHAAVFAGFFAAMFGGTAIQITGPKAPLTLVLSTLVASLVYNPAVPATPVVIIGLVSFCVLLAGLFQVLFGAMGLSSLVKYVPQPVVSGFMNGIALLLIYKQLRPLLGMDPQTSFRAVFLDAPVVNPFAAAVGLITISSIFFAKRYVKRMPASLAALIAGTAVFYLLSALTGHSTSGQVIGSLQLTIPAPTVFFEMRNAIDTLPVASLLPEILFASLILSVLASMESMLSAVVCDDLTGTRHDSKRELIGQGMGNIACSLFGSIAGAGSIPRSVASYKAGGRTRLSGMMCGVFILVMATLGAPLVGRIPIPVVAGIIFVVGLNLFDKWTLNLFRKLPASLSMNRDVLVDFLISLCVAFITICVNLIVAVGIGMVIASALFISKVGRSVVKGRYTGDQFHSRRMRESEQLDMLEKIGHRIVVLTLQGPLFFGSAENLDRQASSLALQCDYLILDFKLVTDIDSTGAKILLQLKHRIEEGGKKLYLSNLKSNRTLWPFLDIMNVAHAFGPDHLFPDTDTALEWAENLLLAQARVPANSHHPIAFSRVGFFNGLSPAEIEAVQQKIRHVTYAKGDAVMSENDRDRDLYVLIKGLLTVKIHLPGRDRYKRLFTYSPGTIFGEMSFLDGSPRSATVWAREDAEVICMTYDGFQALRDQNPALATKLSLNIAVEISQRLRRASNQIRQIEDA